MNITLESQLKKSERLEARVRNFVGQLPGTEQKITTTFLHLHNAGVGEIEQLQVVGNAVVPIIRSDVDSAIYASVSFAVVLECLKAGHTAYRQSDPEFIFELLPATPGADPATGAHVPRFIRYMRGRRDQTKAVVTTFSMATLLSDDWHVAQREDYVNFVSLTQASPATNDMVKD